MALRGIGEGGSRDSGATAAVLLLISNRDCATSIVVVVIFHQIQRYFIFYFNSIFPARSFLTSVKLSHTIKTFLTRLHQDSPQTLCSRILETKIHLLRNHTNETSIQQL